MPHRESHKGIFNPLNESKYKGTKPIVFRSKLELNFFRWCDRNDKVIQWGSESVVIPYLSPKDGRIHKYFVDGVLILETPKGRKKYLIEIKPEKQCQPPSPTSRMSAKNKMIAQYNWAINSAKWEAAKGWCDKNGFEFQLLTERDLK